ncbi:cytochrome b [Marinobacter changyiensis]|uniref:cytochrome b n=1 Tax=Marinobacter changyiensis TaxID=2604091 RepID=UPI001264CC1E|nr:cytochrome b [Marinobacter changyiensis]
MQVRNSPTRFGVISIALHWIIAIAVFGLFGLGYYMVDLTYYDQWYRSAPHIHKSVGLLLLGTVILRLIWRLANAPPAPLSNHQRWEVVAAQGVHGLLYLLLIVAMVSGYLISTLDGSSIDVFNWFSVPSVTGPMRFLEEIAGMVHYWATWALVVLAGLHGLAAVKHHVIDKDNTLRRMLGF